MSAAVEGIQVLKFGGDAVATGELITRVAEAIATRCATGPVVAVTSARRGITDSLLALANQVSAVGAAAPRPAAADRAVAAGEIVTASLVAAALEQRGVRAVALDAREAGIRGRTVGDSVRLSAIRTTRIRKLLAAGITPVIAGFQVYDGTLIRIIGRGGSDLTAVALAVSLGATRCSFFKSSGLKAADPLRHPDAPHLEQGDYPTLKRLLRDNSQFLHIDAARVAERHHLELEFVPFPAPGPVSLIRAA